MRICKPYGINALPQLTLSYLVELICKICILGLKVDDILCQLLVLLKLLLVQILIIIKLLLFCIPLQVHNNLPTTHI